MNVFMQQFWKSNLMQKINEEQNIKLLNKEKIWPCVCITPLHSIPCPANKNTHLLNFKKMPARSSLVVQWLRIRLPMQGTRVRALVWEDPTCCGATGPVSHNYWAYASGACAPQQERPPTVRGPRTAIKSGPRSPQLEKSPRTETKTQHSQK